MSFNDHHWYVQCFKSRKVVPNADCLNLKVLLEGPSLVDLKYCMYYEILSSSPSEHLRKMFALTLFKIVGLMELCLKKSKRFLSRKAINQRISCSTRVTNHCKRFMYKVVSQRINCTFQYFCPW